MVNINKRYGVMNIREVNDSIEIYYLLKEFDKEFLSPLSLKVENLKQYAEKSAENACACVSQEGEEVKGFIAFYNNNTITYQAYLTLLVLKEQWRNQGIAQG